ncbi:hypothetical protein DBB42_06075 [Pseudomonas plecoglossicida]|uniref:Uncharacterized protein n=1 Tax=Pseudomonas plecoglossicida TaxID=70775 RepID=A0A2R7UMP1_PSEDL|nr:hypothetical protein DBB42_06075 [Pseudomonas plecoglossicida]RFQ05103.1 hypothetical protein D0O09_04850 [Pseudomonas putida]
MPGLTSRPACSADGQYIPLLARSPCGSGRAREEFDAVAGTGCAGVRGHARSHRDRVARQGWHLCCFRLAIRRITVKKMRPQEREGS